MTDAQELRLKAALYRRVASIPTQGGRMADRALITLAKRLEREAEFEPEEEDSLT